MLVKLPLKNADQAAIVDAFAYEAIMANDYLQSIHFMANLRRHSSGYAFFQKNWPLKNGTYKNETIYLHKLIAEKYLPKPVSEKRLVVMFRNGNPLDCRVDNMVWTDLSIVARNTKTTDNSNGYRGVVKQGNKYKAIIYYKKKRIVIGKYDTARDAAEAYNKKSLELFGKTLGLNKIRREEPAPAAAREELAVATAK